MRHTYLKKFLTPVRGIIDRISYRFFLFTHIELREADSIFTHLTLLEKKKLYELATKVRDGGYALEIGSYLGASACFIAAGLKKNSKLICIDTFENDAMSEGKRNTEHIFDENTKQFHHKIIKIKGYSKDVFHKVENITKGIDFLFIDGDHSYEGCKTDWILYGQLLKSGSYVAFHDYGWADGVIKVVNELVKPKLKHYEILPNLFWGVIR